MRLIYRSKNGHDDQPALSIFGYKDTYQNKNEIAWTYFT